MQSFYIVAIILTLVADPGFNSESSLARVPSLDRGTRHHWHHSPQV